MSRRLLNHPLLPCSLALAALLGCMNSGAKKICGNLIALETKAEQLYRAGEALDAWAADCATAVGPLKGKDKPYYECLQKCATSSTDLSGFERCDQECPTGDETERLSKTAKVARRSAGLDTLTPDIIRMRLEIFFERDGYQLLSAKDEAGGWRATVLVGKKDDTSRPMTAATVLLKDVASRDAAEAELDQLSRDSKGRSSGIAGSKKLLFVRCDLQRDIGETSANECVPYQDRGEVKRILENALGG